jgi:membrane-bound lytic murein transglycosylase MltF
MRPAPMILEQHNISDYFQMQVAHADEWWMVVYKDRPIQLREVEHLSTRKKYIRNGSPHYSTTKNLAERLNTMFKCTDFKALKVM